MLRIHFLLVSLLSCAGWLSGSSAAPAADRPNLVVVLCDDLGYGDLGCYGHRQIQTPNLDRMAAEGIRLTSCYAAAPVCSSSRAGLLTGRNPNRSGIYDWLPDGIPVYLKTDEPTVPGVLSEAGYRTALVGKWHLNGQFNQPSQPQPGDYRFDHWMATQNNAAPDHQNPNNFVRNGRAVGSTEGFSCQLVADEAIQWLGDNAAGEQPFYLHVCFHEPHEPVESPPELVDHYRKSAKNDDQAQYFANVANMDAAVGRILDKLRQLDVAENTLVWFTSDNGPETLRRYRGADRSYGSPGPLRGMKLHIYEGGIRVPGILWWPGRAPAGVESDTPISGVDLLPTACELAGVDVPDVKPIDGESLLPVLEGESVRRQRPLFWWYYRALTPPRFALRDGPWKLVAVWDGPLMREAANSVGRNINPKSIEVVKTAQLSDFALYHLQDDLGETTDVAPEHPDVVQRMKRQAKAIYREVQNEAPRWPETAEFWQR